MGTITIAATGGGSGALNNFTATAFPQTTDDETEGYSAGSVWFYDNIFYVCLDPSTGAAVWQQINGLLDNFDADNYPQPTDDVTEGYSAGSLFFYPPQQLLWTCTDPTEGAAVWQLIASPNITPLTVITASDVFTTGLSSNMYYTVDTATNPSATSNAFNYINGSHNTGINDYFEYSPSSWTYDTTLFSAINHYTQDYDTDPPTLADYEILFQKVVTDADGNITEVDHFDAMFISPTFLSYAQPIPETAGLLLQTSSDPHGISYGPLELASIDPTGATANQLVGFDGTEFNLFYALNGVNVSTDTSTTLTAGAASVQSLDATGGSISITLPASSTCPGQVFYFANTASSGSNTVTVSLASGDVQVGAGDLTLNNGGLLGLVSDGTGNWIVISSL